MDKNESRNMSNDTQMDAFHPQATRTLYINNLNIKTITSDLRQMFESFGEIIQTRIIYHKVSSKEAFGFVQYVDITSVVNAIRAMDGKILKGNQLNLGFGKSRPTNCIWIGGVVKSVRVQKLRTYNSRFGSVNHCVIDRSRQHALVFFQLMAHAQLAVTHMHGSTLNGGRLQVDFASTNCQRKFYEHFNVQLSVYSTEFNDQQIAHSPLDCATDIITIDDDDDDESPQFSSNRSFYNKSDLGNSDVPMNNDSNIIFIPNSGGIHSPREENVVIELLDDSSDNGSDNNILNSFSTTNFTTSANNHHSRKKSYTYKANNSPNYTQCLGSSSNLLKLGKTLPTPTTELTGSMNILPNSSVVSISSGITVSSASHSVKNICSPCSTLSMSSQDRSIRFPSTFSNHTQKIEDNNTSGLIYTDMGECSSNGTKTLFIGNLNNNISDVDLKKTFELFGEIFKVDVKKKNNATGTETYAFIKYVDAASVERAISVMDGQKLLGNVINVAFGKSLETYCVLINGISELVSKTELKTNFHQFGTIVDCQIDRLKQQALIYFQWIINAQLAVVHMHGYLMKGKKLKVDFASLECQQEFYENLNDSLSESCSMVNSVQCKYTSQLSSEKEKVTTIKNVVTPSFTSDVNVGNSHSRNPNDPRIHLISYSNPQNTRNFKMDLKTQVENDSVHRVHSSQTPRMREPMSLPLPQFAMRYYNSLLNPPRNCESDDSHDINVDEPNFTKRYDRFQKNYDEWDRSRTRATNIDTCVRLQSKYKLIDNVNSLQPSDIVKSILAKPSVFNQDTKRLEHISDKNSSEHCHTSQTSLNFQNVQRQQLCSSSLLMHSRSSPVNDTDTKNDSENFLNSRYEYIRNWLHSINQQYNDPVDNLIDTVNHQKLSDTRGNKEEKNIQHKIVEQTVIPEECIGTKKTTDENESSKLPISKNTSEDKIDFGVKEDTVRSILLSSIENVHKTMESKKSKCDVETKNSNKSAYKLLVTEKKIDSTFTKKNSIHFDHNKVENEKKKELEPKKILVSKPKECGNSKNVKKRLATDKTKINEDKMDVAVLDKISETKNKTYIINKIYKKDDVKEMAEENDIFDRFKQEEVKKNLNEHKNDKPPTERRVCSSKRKMSDSSVNLDVHKRSKTDNKNFKDKNNVTHMPSVLSVSSSKTKNRENRRHKTKTDKDKETKKVEKTQNKREIGYGKHGEGVRSRCLQKIAQGQYTPSMYDRVKARATKNKQKQEEKQLEMKRYKIKEDESERYDTNSYSDSVSTDIKSDSDYECDP